MEGLEKLESQVLELNDYNISSIFDYLRTRTDLYEKFNNEEKSIQEMYDFVCKKAKEKAKNNVAMVNDNVVYLWAITYFSKSNKELGITQKNTISQVPNTSGNSSDIKKNNKEIRDDKAKMDQISIFGEVKK